MKIVDDFNDHNRLDIETKGVVVKTQFADYRLIEEGAELIIYCDGIMTIRPSATNCIVIISRARTHKEAHYEDNLPKKTNR